MATQSIPANPSLWLRGVPNWPWRHHPLSLDFDVLKSSYTDDDIRMDVTGCIIAGDGSGGPHSKDPRARVCSFGLVCIKPYGKRGGFSMQWYANGSVPGNQTVPRADATAILHALRTTKGDAPFLCDSERVALTYAKGASGTANGLLWQAIWEARQRRLQLGYGSIEVTLLPSHTNWEDIEKAGIIPIHWAANHLAAAKWLSQKFQAENDQLLDNSKAASEVLTRLMEVACIISPSTKANQDPQTTSFKFNKLHYALSLAKDSGHSVDEASGLCVACCLSIGLKKSLAKIKGVLAQPCLGKQSFTFGGVVRHQGNILAAQLLPLYNINVHSTHNMATHVGLKVHFCTRCGAYGKDMACFLKLPCPSKASISGR